jgi:Flp pilus assembly protein TadD
MALDEPRSCPDPDTLGAFLDGTLDPAERQRVADHVQDCNYCIYILRETSLYERQTARKAPPWRTALPIAAGIIIAIVTAALIVLRDRVDPVKRLAAAAQESGVRTIEGRVVSFDYARYTSTRSLGAIDTAVNAAAKGVLADVETPDSAREWHTQGVANLLLDRVEQAVRDLAEAVRLRPESAEYHSDLAAARIALGTLRQDSAELRRGLQEAEEATRLDPRSATAAFNRAIALDRLENRAAARAAYVEYLHLDGKSPWAAEVRWRLDRLNQ